MHETCLIIIHDPGMRPGPKFSPRDYFLKRRVTDVQSDLQVDLLQGPTSDWGVIGAVFTAVNLNLASLRFQDGSSVIMLQGRNIFLRLLVWKIQM